MSNECCNNNCNQGRDCPERRVADRRATGAQFAADSHLQTVKAQQAIILAKGDEIKALTAEVARMAAALDAGGTVTGSVLLQARSPEGDPWQTVSIADFWKAQANGYDVQIIGAPQPVAAAQAVPEGQPDPNEWLNAERIRDLPDVDAALFGFLADCTGDNAACVVRAVLRAAAPVAQPTDTTKGA